MKIENLVLRSLNGGGLSKGDHTVVVKPHRQGLETAFEGTGPHEDQGVRNELLEVFSRWARIHLDSFEVTARIVVVIGPTVKQQHITF